MDDDAWWKVYLETVYLKEDELLNYARKYNVMQNSKVQERLWELQDNEGSVAFKFFFGVIDNKIMFFNRNRLVLLLLSICLISMM